MERQRQLLESKRARAAKITSSAGAGAGAGSGPGVGSSSSGLSISRPTTAFSATSGRTGAAEKVKFDTTAQSMSTHHRDAMMMRPVTGKQAEQRKDLWNNNRASMATRK